MKPVFVAGKGRSGTTWLARSIRGDDRYIFEPFHPNWNREAAALFETDPRGCLRELFAGRLGLDLFARPVPSHGLVVKEIRRLEWLPLLVEWFPDVEFVWITRDETERCASMRRVGWAEEDAYALYSTLDFVVPDRMISVRYETLDVAAFTVLLERLGRPVTPERLAMFAQMSPTSAIWAQWAS